MPYIDQRSRQKFEKPLADLFAAIDADGVHPYDMAGVLNYLLTRILFEQADQHAPSYAMYNMLIGVLECCKQEFYRRMVVPHENRKRDQNGEVFKRGGGRDDVPPNDIPEGKPVR